MEGRPSGPAPSRPATADGMPTPLKDQPGREEILYVMLEHNRGDFVWVSEIKRDESGKPTLGQFHREDGINLGGRFSNMLPASSTPKYDA